MFPSDCRFCQASLFSISRLPVCSSCLESIQPIQRARCNVCGHLLAPADAAFGDACCRGCATEAPAFARAVNYGAYTGVLRELIHLLKYDRVRAAATPLGRFTAAACLQLEGDIDVPELVMIPVPAHKLRLRSRGFNQAELIARAAQRGIEEATRRRVTLEPAAMLRVRFAESQVALTAEERQKQIRGAFKVVARERVKGREILLVDDVLTTGATAGECARELRQAGAARVWVVTPARALAQQALIDEMSTGLAEAGSAPPSRSPLSLSAPPSAIPSAIPSATSSATPSNCSRPLSFGASDCASESDRSAGSSFFIQEGTVRSDLPVRRGKPGEHELSNRGGQRAGGRRLDACPL